MAYTPTEWKTGDTITAEKLNKLEQGVKRINDKFLLEPVPLVVDGREGIYYTPEDIRYDVVLSDDITVEDLMSGAYYVKYEDEDETMYALVSQFGESMFETMSITSKNNCVVVAENTTGIYVSAPEYPIAIFPTATKFKRVTAK